jgi:tetratricopeptide (TPR) repeat protein
VLFSLLPAILLTALLVAAELIVRAGVPPPDGDLVQKVEFDGRQWFQVNRRFLARYFSPASPSVPEFKPSLFQRTKGPDTFRVFCIGGSSMFGTPYVLTANIPGLIRRQLRALRPDLEIEVVNWGASAINSNVVRDLAPRLAGLEPDLVLVYMGHNEFYGPDGVGASFLERWFPSLTKLKYSLMDLRLAQLFLGWLGKTTAVPGEQANLMRQVSQGALVRAGGAEERRITALFGENLRAIVLTFLDRDVPVILSEIGSNLLFPPFVSDSLVDGRDVTGAVLQLRRDVENGRPGEALTAARLIAGGATDCAAVEYWKGRALFELGRLEESDAALLRAVDLDLLKFRAPRAINVILREVSAEMGLPLVRADSIVMTNVRSGVPWDALFWEHLHPTFFGYDLLARGFVKEILAHRLLPAGAAARKDLLPFQRDSLGVCWLDLAYADLSIQRLTGQWPFSDYERAPAVLGSEDPQLERIALGTYARQMTVDEGCYRSATFFWSRGRLGDARTTYETLLDEYPFGFYPTYLLGSLLNHAGDPSHALDYYRRSVKSNPEFLKSRLDAGLILVNMGRVREGEQELEEVIRRAGPEGPRDVRAAALYGLSAAYANRGDLERAVAFADRSLLLAPGSREARDLRQRLRQVTGK